MSLKRLAIRTKKSLSGLYSLSTSDNIPSEKTSDKPVITNITTTTTIENVAPSQEDSSKCRTASVSPGKGSPSRRKRILGSLRSMSSLRSLRSQNSNKSNEDQSRKVDTPQTPQGDGPSLALNFEVSPPDQPMFEPTRNRSTTFSPDVHHSSPIAVPMLTKRMETQSTPLGLLSFKVGTVPDSPAPLQKPSVQKSILNHSTITPPTSQSQPLTVPVVDLHPTPMLGTNLCINTREPEIVVSSPSATCVQDNRDYFNMPVLHKDVERSDSFIATDGPDLSDDIDAVSTFLAIVKPINEQSKPVPRKLEPMHSNGFTMPNVNSDSFALEGSSRNVHYSDELGNDFCYLVWEDPAIADGLHESMNASSEGQLEDSIEGKDSFDDPAYLAWDDPAIASEDKYQLERRNTWCRHTGLYDGTGYGDEASSVIARSSNSMSLLVGSGTEITEPSISKSNAQDNEALETYINSEPASTPFPSEPIDEKEALQEIIRTYACPMLYGDETREKQANEEVGVDAIEKTKLDVMF